MPDDHSEPKYPDGALAKALRQAVKPWSDPAQARLVWRRLFRMLDERGANAPDLLPKSPGLGLTPHEADRQRLIDACAWGISSALSMGTMADDFREHLSACARVFGTPRQRRPRKAGTKALTERQRTVYEAVCHHSGNIAATARALNRDPSTVRQHYKAALRKLKEVPLPKAKTWRFSEDWRGQVNVDADRRRPQQG